MTEHEPPLPKNKEAAQRLAANGPNELKEGRRISPFQIFLGQFKSLIIWILIAAGVISGVLGEGLDAIAILAIVVSASFGFQVWIHHNAILGRLLKTSSMSLTDSFLLLAVGAIPLLTLPTPKAGVELPSPQSTNTTASYPRRRFRLCQRHRRDWCFCTPTTTSPSQLVRKE